ncbi:MAG: hypothetical protein J0L82_04975 [Deltaproteobacteria bacterium]|jgi:hypothetical protein|nr:hypothetical protein [Deltaproteobacteria bacterium]
MKSTPCCTFVVSFAFLVLVASVMPAGSSWGANQVFAGTVMTKLQAIEHAMSLVEPKRQLLETELFKFYTRNGSPTEPALFPKPLLNANGLFLGLPEEYNQVYSVLEADEIRFYKYSVRECQSPHRNYCPKLWEYSSSTPIVSITYKDKFDSAGNKVGCLVRIEQNMKYLFSMGLVAVTWNPKYHFGSDGDVLHPFWVTYPVESSFEVLGCL